MARLAYPELHAPSAAAAPDPGQARLRVDDFLVHSVLERRTRLSVEGAVVLDTGWRATSGTLREPLAIICSPLTRRLSAVNWNALDVHALQRELRERGFDVVDWWPSPARRIERWPDWAAEFWIVAGRVRECISARHAFMGITRA